MAQHVVVLPGFLGSRLDVKYNINLTATSSWEPGRVDVMGTGGVVLNPYPRIEMADNGFDNQGGGSTRLNGIVPGYYEELLIKLGDIFPKDHVHIVPYDWRQSIQGAWGLVDSYFGQHIIPTGEDFFIVGHSMGGLIARMLWKFSSAPFKARCRRIVCLGTPHWGTWDVIRCFYRLDDLWHQCYKAAQYSVGNLLVNANPFTATPFNPATGEYSKVNEGVANDLDKALTSWPGLYDLLPNPAAPGGWSSNAAKFLNADNWPDKGAIDHVSGTRFGLRLAEAATTQTLLADASTHPPADVLVDVICDTLAARNGLPNGTQTPDDDKNYSVVDGDGRVYKFSAELRPNYAWKIDAEHFEMPRIAARCIGDILTGELPNPSDVTPIPNAARPYPGSPMVPAPPPAAASPPSAAPVASTIAALKKTASGIPQQVPATSPPPEPVAKPWGPNAFSPGQPSPLSGNPVPGQ